MPRASTKENPGQTAEKAQGTLHNLPVPLNPLIGRDPLVSAAVSRLRGDCRLLTFVGPGGVGKTRLALRVAEMLVPAFADGVVFVPLAPLTAPEELPFALVNHLAAVEESPDIAASLAAHLRARRMLLVVDNCEHVLDAMPLLSGLLASCAGLKVLATSREPLGLYGEQEFPVPPLDLPQSAGFEDIAGSPSISLLLQSARAVRPTFELTPDNAPELVELCGRLGGLPLAIEIVAARLKHQSPGALLETFGQRLHWTARAARGVPLRQQTLYHAVDWSCQRLDAGEQALFARVALFAGGCTAEAAEWVCNAENDLPFPVLEGLLRLAEKNLLQVDSAAPETLFTQQETVRLFALDRLRERGEEQPLRERFALYYVHLAEQAEPQLWGETQHRWLERLRREEANWRPALDWALGPDVPETATLLGVRLVIALRRFWEIRGRFGEARAWYDRALLVRALLSPADQGRLFNLAGSVAQFQGRLPEAREHHGQALRLAESLGDPAARSTALQFLGMAAGREGAYDTAEQLLSEVVAIERERGSAIQLSVALNNLALAARELGDYARAAALLEESLALKRSRGDELAVATALASLGTLALLQGDAGGAFAYQRESLELRRALGDRPGMVVVLCNLAAIAAALNAEEQACRLYAAAATLAEAMGSRFSADIDALYRRDLAALRAALGEERFDETWRAGAAMNLAEVLALAARFPQASPARPPRPAGVALPGEIERLTARELDVLRLVARGLSDAEVASVLVLSRRTVSTHLHRIYSKLDVPSRTAAARYALDHGLL